MFAIFTYIRLIIRIAFLVLTERAVLSLSQIRKRPNVVGPWGVIQSVADRVKLITKNKIYLSPTSVLLYSLSPPLLTVLTRILIITCPIPIPLSIISYSILAIFCITSIISLPFILLGISYRSVYSTVGSVRVVRLIMSYEILLLLLIIFYRGSFTTSTWIPFVNQRFNSVSNITRFWLIIPIIVLWLIELRRTPFDLAERESELVSRFNVEYRRWGFLLFFFSEILCLLTISLIFSILILQLTRIVTITCRIVRFVILSLYVRAALPRFRLLDTQSFVWFRLTPLVIFYRIVYIELRSII